MAGARKENGKSQRFSVRISSLEGLLVNRGKFTLKSPVGLVKPSFMPMRGKGFGGLSWRGKVTGARRTHVTIPVTVKVTQGRGEIVGNIDVAHGATRSLDAGNALKWSGATPLRCHGNRGGRSRRPKGSRQQKEACGAAVSSENPEGASEEGKNCSLHFLLLQFLHTMKQVAV